jgi:hypothetical protein
MDQFNHNFGRNNYASVGQAYDHKLYESANAHLYNPNEKVKESIYDHNLYGNPSVKSKIDAFLLIDSAERDHTKYPDPDKYKIKLKNVYKDVTSIELISADFPQSSYTINEYNNTIRYQQTVEQVDNGTYSEITIPVGNWPVYHATDTDICELIVNAFQENDACYIEYGDPNIVAYSVTVNEYTQTFEISKTVTVPSAGLNKFRIFNLLFNDGQELKYNDNDPAGTFDEYQTKYPPYSIAPLLGFSRKNLTAPRLNSGSVEAMVWSSDQAYNLRMDKYIVLNIRGWERINSPTEAVDGAFAVINLDPTSYKFRFTKKFSGFDNEAYVKFFNPRMGILSELDISITDREGRPFLFNGGDHVLQFQISTSTAQEKVN